MNGEETAADTVRQLRHERAVARAQVWWLNDRVKQIRGVLKGCDLAKAEAMAAEVADEIAELKVRAESVAAALGRVLSNAIWDGCSVDGKRTIRQSVFDEALGALHRFDRETKAAERPDAGAEIPSVCQCPVPGGGPCYADPSYADRVRVAVREALRDQRRLEAGDEAASNVDPPAGWTEAGWAWWQRWCDEHPGSDLTPEAVVELRAIGEAYRRQVAQDQDEALGSARLTMDTLVGVLRRVVADAMGAAPLAGGLRTIRQCVVTDALGQIGWYDETYGPLESE